MVKSAAVDEILIVVDAGNTNTVFGVFRGDELVADFRLSTDSEKTSDEYAGLLLPLLGRASVDPEKTASVIVSSVVPPM